VSSGGRSAAGIGKPERLLPLACIVAAAVLLASERMSTFELVAGSPASGNSLCDLAGSDRHHHALGVLAIFAIVAVLVAILGGSRPAALGVAVAGLGALLIFLIVDLPKANDIGSVSSACDLAGQGIDAKAVPRAGFWLELVGAVALTLSGTALAALNPDQLRALRPRRRGDGGQPRAEKPST
jgi:hypothetical protein